MRQLFFISLILIIIFILSCTNWDLTDPGPQPIILEDVEHQPKLNMLGILRPDSANGLSLSFVHVEISFPINDYPDSTIVPDAEVKVLKLEGNTPVDSSIFIYSDFGILPNKEYRSRSFFPKKGTYQLICQKEGFPIVKAQTTIPDVPQIEDGSFHVQENTLSFKIARDENVGYCEVVLQGNNWLVRDRFLKPKQGNIPVEFFLNGIPKGECVIKIYAFDNNQ